jgi:uncharacterized membrane protein
VGAAHAVGGGGPGRGGGAVVGQCRLEFAAGLLFASLGLLAFFADHLLHSIQVDAIMETVQRNTLAVIEDGLLTGGQEAPGVPAWAVPVVSRRSGYVQAVWPGTLLTCALEQDAAFGIRQLVDVACKALSPAVNDPYTAIQAVDHLSVIFCALARRPLGTHVAGDGQGVVIVPARRFGDYLGVMCGLIRRYGASEPTVANALLRLLGNCAAVAGDDPGRRADIEEQARITVSDAEREVAQPADLRLTHAEAESVLRAVAKPPPEPSPGTR